MEFRNVDTVMLGGGKIVVGFLNGPRQSEVPSFGRDNSTQLCTQYQFYFYVTLKKNYVKKRKY
jgi:hypothetical protein